MSVGWIVVSFFSPLPRQVLVELIDVMLQQCLLPPVWPRSSLLSLPVAVPISGQQF